MSRERLKARQMQTFGGKRDVQWLMQWWQRFHEGNLIIIIYLIIIYLPDWGKVQQGAHSPAKYCISSKLKHHPDSHYISDLMLLRQMY